MNFKDYYKILEVERTASQAEIKKAYRRLAMIYHPDKNHGDKVSEERFKEIAEAYTVLSDAVQRKKFDDFSGSRAKFDFSGSSYSDSDYDGSDLEDETLFGDLYNEDEDADKGFSEFFKEFFSSRFKKKTSDYDYANVFKGEDRRGKITIDLEEAFVGSQRIITIDIDKIRLTLKPGIKNDQILKVRSYGKESEYGGESGDLFVRIVVRPHLLFKRDDKDLYCDLPVDIFTILLGGKKTIKTFNGDMQITIPQNCSNGEVLRLRGMGMPDYDVPNYNGDLYAKVVWVLPKNLNAKEIELIRRLRKIHQQRTRSAY